MLNPIKLFTSFGGRIGRLSFWLGIFVLAAVSPFSFSSLFSNDPLSEIIKNVQQLGGLGLLWSVGLIYVMAALITKRLHDRNKSGIYAALFYGPALVQSATFFVGDTNIIPYIETFQNWSWLIGLELAAVGIWFFVELGLYGAKEPNRF